MTIEQTKASDREFITPDCSTPKAALERCIELWTVIAKEGFRQKETAFKYLGWYLLEANCPACEYDIQQQRIHYLRNCTYCPVDAWRGIKLACIREDSPFEQWSRAAEDLNFSDNEAALKIVALCEKSLENLAEAE